MFTIFNIIIIIEQDPVVVVIRFETDGGLGGIAKNVNAHLRLPRYRTQNDDKRHNDDIM